MVARVEGVDGALEDAREGTEAGMSVTFWECSVWMRWVCVLSNALIVPFTPEEAVDNHNWVSIRGAFFIVESVCEIYCAQACRRVERVLPYWTRHIQWRYSFMRELRSRTWRIEWPYASLQGAHG